MFCMHRFLILTGRLSKYLIILLYYNNNYLYYYYYNIIIIFIFKPSSLATPCIVL